MTFAFASLRVLILVMVLNFINAQIHHEDSIDLRRNYKDDKTRALVLEKQACKHQTHEVSDIERSFLPCNVGTRRLDTTYIYSSCVSIVGCVNIFVRFFSTATLRKFALVSARINTHHSGRL